MFSHYKIIDLFSSLKIQPQLNIFLIFLCTAVKYKDEKIGYANLKGEIVIKPKFDWLIRSKGNLQKLLTIVKMKQATNIQCGKVMIGIK